MPAAAGLGRSRGGLSSQLHAGVDALGNALRLVLTAGQQADCPQLSGLLDGLPKLTGKVLADKDYDTNKVLAAIANTQPKPSFRPRPTGSTSGYMTRICTPIATRWSAFSGA